MKFLGISLGVLLILIGFSCKSKIDLPNVQLITDLIDETLLQDSLNSSVPINIQLVDYYLYIEPKLNNLRSDSIVPPPPPRYPNKIGEEPIDFDSYRRELKYVLDYSINSEDSLFFINQVTLNKKVLIDSNRIDKRFIIKNFSCLNFRDKWKDEIYFFKLPILNKDKNIAIIEYDYYCSGCGHGQEVILKKLNNKWILIQSIRTWTN